MDPGYPDYLVGNDIPLIAQIMGLVDAFDAITTAQSRTRARTPRRKQSTSCAARSPAAGVAPTWSTHLPRSSTAAA